MAFLQPAHSVLPAAALAALLAASVPAQAPQEYCRTSRGDMTNGYHYEMWIQDGTSGTACLTVYGSDARFKVAWNLGGYGFVARVGRFFDQTKTDEQLGWITADWEHTKTGTGTSWVGIYGWTVDPLMEYYIIEDWIGWRPQYTKKGVITVDSGEYDVYFNTRVNQPSIKGTNTFNQWYSVRKTPRLGGHISISEHFSQWKALGMPTGKLYEAKLKVEGLSGSGTVDFTKATVTVGTKPTALADPHPRWTAQGKRVRLASTGPGLLSLHALDGTLLGTRAMAGPEESFLPLRDPRNGFYVVKPQ